MKVKVVEATPAIAPHALPLIAIEEEVQVAELLMLALLVEPTIIEVAEEEEPVKMGLLVIETMAEVLPATATLLISKAVGEATGEVAKEEGAGKATVGNSAK